MSRALEYDIFGRPVSRPNPLRGLAVSFGLDVLSPGGPTPPPAPQSANFDLPGLEIEEQYKPATPYSPQPSARSANFQMDTLSPGGSLPYSGGAASYGTFPNAPTTGSSGPGFFGFLANIIGGGQQQGPTSLSQSVAQYAQQDIAARTRNIWLILGATVVVVGGLSYVALKEG